MGPGHTIILFRSGHTIIPFRDYSLWAVILDGPTARKGDSRYTHDFLVYIHALTTLYFFFTHYTRPLLGLGSARKVSGDVSFHVSLGLSSSYQYHTEVFSFYLSGAVVCGSDAACFLYEGGIRGAVFSNPPAAFVAAYAVLISCICYINAEVHVHANPCGFGTIGT